MAQKYILVVDDDPDVRAIFKAILETAGFAAVGAVDGAAAVKIASAHAPDLVIMDLMVPVMDGWQALDRLKESLGPDIPVLAITSADIDIKEAREAGLCGLISKPIIPNRIVEAVRLCVESQSRGETWVEKLEEWWRRRSP